MLLFLVAILDGRRIVWIDVRFVHLGDVFFKLSECCVGKLGERFWLHKFSRVAHVLGGLGL